MQQAPVVEKHHCAWVELENDLILFIVQLTSEKLQIAVEVADLVGSHRVQGKSIIHVVADLHGLARRRIEDNDRGVPFVMTTCFFVVVADDRRGEALVSFWMLLLDFIRDFEAIDEEALASSAAMVHAMEHQKPGAVIEVRVVVVRR